MTTAGGALGGLIPARRSREGACWHGDTGARGRTEGRRARGPEDGRAGRPGLGRPRLSEGAQTYRKTTDASPTRPYPRQLGQHAVLTLPRNKDDRAGRPYPRQRYAYVVTRSRPYPSRGCGVERVARGGRMSGIPLTYASPYPGLFIGRFHGRQAFGGSLEGRGGGGGYHAEGIPNEHARRFQSQSGDRSS